MNVIKWCRSSQIERNLCIAFNLMGNSKKKKNYIERLFSLFMHRDVIQFVRYYELLSSTTRQFRRSEMCIFMSRLTQKQYVYVKLQN